MDPVDLENLIRPLLLKDLRIQCRQRGISPAGSRDDLAMRLKEHMIRTNDYLLRTEDGAIMNGPAVTQLFGQASTNQGNNYMRSSGQNVDNFLGDRPSSRVLAAPGGNSSFSLGHEGSGARHAVPAQAPVTPAGRPSAPTATATPRTANSSFLDSMAEKIAGKAGKLSPAPPPAEPVGHTWGANQPTENVRVHPAQQVSATVVGSHNNNYHRPGGQNVGNFLTDKPSSRVLAPPGGGSSLTLG